MPSAPPGRPRSTEADEAILEAAVDLFAECGFDGLTVEGVAARAGVGKATIYRRYPGKLDLVIAASRCFALDDDDLAPDTGDTRAATCARWSTGCIAMVTTTPIGRALPMMVADRAADPRARRSAPRARRREAGASPRSCCSAASTAASSAPTSTSKLVIDILRRPDLLPVPRLRRPARRRRSPTPWSTPSSAPSAPDHSPTNLRQQAAYSDAADASCVARGRRGRRRGARAARGRGSWRCRWRGSRSPHARCGAARRGRRGAVRSRSCTKSHAPMFAGSSCTHHTSRAFGYASSEREELGSRATGRAARPARPRPARRARRARPSARGRSCRCTASTRRRRASRSSVGRGRRARARKRAVGERRRRVERVCGMRRYRFGVKHTSGIALDGVAWRRSTWKYCAAVDG